MNQIVARVRTPTVVLLIGILAAAGSMPACTVAQPMEAGLEPPPPGLDPAPTGLGPPLVDLKPPVDGLEPPPVEPPVEPPPVEPPPVEPPPVQPPPARPESPPMVNVFPGDHIQSKVDSAPGGTRFLIKAGVHLGQTIRPKDGDSFIGEPGAILDGQNAIRYAFDGVTEGPPFPSNVTIRGLVVRRYQGPLQSAAILAGHMWKSGAVTTGWIIEDNEVTGNAAGGIRIGSHTQVLRNNVHHNGQIGISGVGDSTLVADNEIAYNNTANVDPSWEAGGAKFVLTHDLVVRGNFVHHNNGIGLWSDISSSNTLYENNRVEDNAYTGIFIEVSYGAIIRNNLVRRNGFSQPEPAWVLGAGIMVANSSDVEIYDNTVTDNRQGITGYHQRRGVTPEEDSLPKPYGPWNTRNNYVHDNVISMTVGMTGMAQNVDLGLSMFTLWNNRFANNRYVIPTTNRLPFAWANTPMTAAQWIAAGQDVAGTFSGPP